MNILNWFRKKKTVDIIEIPEFTFKYLYIDDVKVLIINDNIPFTNNEPTKERVEFIKHRSFNLNLKWVTCRVSCNQKDFKRATEDIVIINNKYKLDLRKQTLEKVIPFFISRVTDNDKSHYIERCLFISNIDYDYYEIEILRERFYLRELETIGELKKLLLNILVDGRSIRVYGKVTFFQSTEDFLDVLFKEDNESLLMNHPIFNNNLIIQF